MLPVANSFKTNVFDRIEIWNSCRWMSNNGTIVAGFRRFESSKLLQTNPLWLQSLIGARMSHNKTLETFKVTLGRGAYKPSAARPLEIPSGCSCRLSDQSRSWKERC